MRYKPTHFKVDELFPPEMMKQTEDSLWLLYDEKILIVLDRLREILNKPITVNNWKSGGQFSYRGYRPKTCTVGAPKSAHKQGKGVDFDVKGMSAKQVRDFIISRRDQFPEITRMEDGVNWVHIDIIPTGLKNIKLFKP